MHHPLPSLPSSLARLRTTTKKLKPAADFATAAPTDQSSPPPHNNKQPSHHTIMFFGGGDPFEHFAHGGGGGGGGGSRRSGRSSAAVDTNKLYETLGVSSETLFCSILICHFSKMFQPEKVRKPIGSSWCQVPS